MKAKIGQHHALKDIVKISRYLRVSRYFMMFQNDAIYCFRDISQYKTLSPDCDGPTLGQQTCEESEMEHWLHHDLRQQPLPHFPPHLHAAQAGRACACLVHKLAQAQGNSARLLCHLGCSGGGHLLLAETHQAWAAGRRAGISVYFGIRVPSQKKSRSQKN